MILRLLELRYALWGLEFKSMLKHDFCISETEETRHKRVNSLNACKLQSQLAISELGASCTTFFKMYWLVLWFCSAVIGSVLKCFLKILYFFISRTLVLIFKFLWKKNVRQVSLLVNRSWRSRVWTCIRYVFEDCIEPCKVIIGKYLF
jgi:hypothetical protein